MEFRNITDNEQHKQINGIPVEPLSTELVLVHYADERKKMGREMKKAL